MILGSLLFGAEIASAATATWNGGAVPNGNWATAGNWNGVAPATNDLLVFTGGTQTATTNNFPAGTPFNNISFLSGASSFTLNGNSLVLSPPTDAGSGLIAGGSIKSASANAQTIRVPIILANGMHTIANSGLGILRLNGTITHSNGAVAVLSTNINATGGLSTNGNAYGILGGWAVLGGDWATLDANSNVVAYVGYVTNVAGSTIANNPAANVKIPVNGTAISITTPTTAINSILFGGGGASGAAQVLNIGAGNKLVLGQNGGFFNSTMLSGTTRQLTIGASVAQGGVLTAGDGISPAQITFGNADINPPGTFATVVQVNSSIQDNGSAPVTVTVAGSYFSLNGAAAGPTNSYSGGTYILRGRVSQPTENTFGFGPVYISPGGQANPGKATGTGVNITNDFYIAGTGTVELGGMGALRMFGNGAVVIGAVTTGTKLTGRVTLTDNAAVCANGDITGAIGISGKITGPGGFILGSPTFNGNNNNGAGGVFTVGDVNGATTANDYAGDTTLNGGAGGANNNIGSTLRIFSAANNNIMPHGATGSYAGGKTGNLIFNATAANRACTFDLNGSIQTLNGVSSTVASPANNFITSGNAPGTLILGDNNASATFAGAVQNGSGLSLTKIGTGTQNLNGANTYSGDTIVAAGKLGTTTASSGGGNFSISNNAALGVTTATSGGTLAVNNLTLAPSSSLQLNVGTAGNPINPIVNVTGALTLSGTVTVSIAGSSLTAGGPFTVMTYAPGSRSPSGTFVMANSPRVVASINDNTNSGVVTVTVTSVDTAIKWNGGALGNWDINNTGNNIWQTIPSAAAAHYIESGTGNDAVQFDDTATGTTSVNLTTMLSPQSITVNNSTKNYVLGGTGRITGTTGLTKQGTGTLTLANSGNNDFSGDIALNAGTLIVSNDFAAGNVITGGGNLTKTGPGTLTLSGNNSGYTGQVSVASGTLKVLSSASLASAVTTTIANGASLDIAVNAVNLDTNAIIVSGFGVNSNGAIVNSSGVAGFLVSNFRIVTMTGDTAIGGPGRLDFRATDPTFGIDATLSTGGQPYKLVKLSGSQLQLAGVQIDSALGDIEVQGGILGIQGTMPSLGNPNNTLTVFGGATLQLFGVQSEVNKKLILKDGATFNNANAANTFDGPVTLLGASQFNIGGASVAFTNVLSGGGSLLKVTGNSPMTLSASNTYSGETVINAGSLVLMGDGAIRTSPSITIGTLGTLDASGRTDGTLTLGSGQTLKGNGNINGFLVANAGSTISPGTSIGRLNTTSDVTLQGSTIIEINKSDIGINDQLFAAGQIAYGGTLTINNVGPAYADGDVFTIFNGGGYSGAFVISPSTPAPGLAWVTNNLVIDGTLSVIATQPRVTTVVLNGNNLEVSGTSPFPTGQYYVLASTNVALPLSSWTRIATNLFDAGTFSFTNAISPAIPQRNFMLQLP